MSNELQEAFSRFVPKNNTSFVAKVVDVDKENGICTVSADELEYTEVRLSAVVKERNDVLYFFPSPGSYVVVAPIHNDIHSLMVQQYSEIENFQMITGGTEFNISSDGFMLKNEDENLRSLLLDLIAAIKKMSFTTPHGPTTNLINKMEFESLEPRIKHLLKED